MLASNCTPKAKAETSLDQWARERCELLAEDGARPAMVEGYLECAFGLSPSVERYVGDPFGANDYHEGYALAAYEIGPPELLSDRALELLA